MTEWQPYIKELLTEDEKAAFDQISEWEANPDRLNRIFINLARPVSEGIKKIPEETLKPITDTVKDILKSIRDFSKDTVSAESIMAKISSKENRSISSLDEIREIPLKTLDEASAECISFNRLAAVVEGGLTGIAGSYGLIIDLPVLYGLMFRVIQEIATCYGYAIDTPEEKVYVLKILELGHTTDMDIRKNTIGELCTLHAAIRGGLSLNQLEAMGLIKGLQVLAEKLGSEILRRKLLVAVMAIGGITGAAVNYIIFNQAAEAALNTYRKRFLVDCAERRKSAVIEETGESDNESGNIN